MVLQLFKWWGQTPVGFFMQQSTYAFAIVEMFHLLSLTVLGGAILIIDLRLLGFGFKSQTAGQLATELRRWLLASLGIAIISGILLLSEEPIKCYYSPAFRAKMSLLLLALLFYFGVQDRIFDSEVRNRGMLPRVAGVISLLLWFGVGLSGRAIGFI
jgi:hypothetical protein